jgi:hypothetical protein
MEVVERIWGATGQLCGKRLAPALGLWLPHYERHHGKLLPSQKKLLGEVGSATLDRMLAGLPSVSGATDGLKGAAQFCYPSGVALDAAANIVVADSGNNTIRILPPWMPPAAPASLSATAISTSRVDLV